MNKCRFSGNFLRICSIRAHDLAVSHEIFFSNFRQCSFNSNISQFTSSFCSYLYTIYFQYTEYEKWIRLRDYFYLKAVGRDCKVRVCSGYANIARWQMFKKHRSEHNVYPATLAFIANLNTHYHHLHAELYARLQI